MMSHDASHASLCDQARLAVEDVILAWDAEVEADGVRSRLDPDTRQHLHTCGACDHYLDELIEVHSGFVTSSLEMPDAREFEALSASVLASVQATPAAPRQPSWTQTLGDWWTALFTPSWRPALAGALLITLFAVGYLALRSDPSSESGPLDTASETEIAHELEEPDDEEPAWSDSAPEMAIAQLDEQELEAFTDELHDAQWLADDLSLDDADAYSFDDTSMEGFSEGELVALELALEGMDL